MITEHTPRDALAQLEAVLARWDSLSAHDTGGSVYRQCAAEMREPLRALLGAAGGSNLDVIDTLAECAFKYRRDIDKLLTDEASVQGPLLDWALVAFNPVKYPLPPSYATLTKAPAND